MNTPDIVEAWEQEKLKEGFKEGLRLAVATIYEARFGALPANVAAAIREMSDKSALLDLWPLIVTGTPEQIRQRLLGDPAR